MQAPVTYIPDAVPVEYFNPLWNELDWVRHPKVPRREYYANTLLADYSYGTGEYRRTYKSQPWHTAMIAIHDHILDRTGWGLDACFINGYEDQSDHLGWHSDNSPEMDDEQPIVIVSLGVAREIWFRQIGSSEKESLLLESGSMCVMAPGMQDTHQHRIPKCSHKCGARLSLTFRGFIANESRTIS